MKTWKITLEYDGTKYHGWQEQNNARTVLGELRAAAGELFGEPCDMQGSGRTDAGVHAIAQVLHLRVDTHRGWKAFEIQYGLNDRLPSDIVVLDVEEAPYNFHARHDAELRSYVYQIAIRKTAFAKRHVWWVKEKLDAKPMMEAAKLLAGRHNFANFAAQDPSKPGESTIVHVESASVEPDDFMLVFHITASHYLWKMVRRIVGTLVKIGHHEVTVEQFAQLLEGKPMPELPVPEWTAPSSGLFLEKVTYKGDPKEESVSEVDGEEEVEAEVDETPSHEPIPEHVLAQGKYRAPGVQAEPLNIPFVKPERKDKLPRREAVIPPAKFKPEPLITRDPAFEKPPSKRYDDSPRPVRPPFNGDRSESGDRPRFPGGTRYDGPPTDRPPFRGGDRGGDRPPFRGGSGGGDRPPFRGGSGGGDRPPFRGGSGGGDRPPFRGGSGGGDRPPFRGGSGGGDRPPFRGDDRGGDRPPFRGESGGGDRPPFRGGSGGGDRPPFRGGSGGGDRPPFRGGSGGGDRPPFRGDDRGGDRPPFRGGSGGGDRPPFRGGSGGGDRPPFRGGSGGGDRPPFRGGSGGGDRPPFRSGSGGGDRPPFRGGSGGGDRPPFRGGSGGGDRPPFRGGSGGGDRPPFRGGSGGGGGRPGGKPFGKGGGGPKS